MGEAWASGRRLLLMGGSAFRGEDPGLTGYYLNKLIMERGLEGVLGVSVESGVCRLRCLKE